MNKLQQHADAQPVTDPWPERPDLEDLKFALCYLTPPPKPRRSLWRWLRSFWK